MKFYIASKLQEPARAWRDALIDVGHKVVSSWLDEENFGSGAPYDDAERARCASIDEADIRYCDALILRAEPDLKGVAGGKHVETGIAIALGKPVYVIGPKENIFHWHPNVEVFPTFDQFLIAAWELE